MCGIFGIVAGPSSPLRTDVGLRRSIERLFTLSETRGKEAAGIAVSAGDRIAVFKSAVAPSRMMRRSDYRRFAEQTFAHARGKPVAFIGHSRLVTNGESLLNRNNQPVVGNGVVGIHNGIIVNHDALWKQHDKLERQSQVDSEVIFALLRHHLDSGKRLDEASRATFDALEGAASIAAVLEDRDELLLSTNNGSLYYRSVPRLDTFVFTSERYILDQFAATQDVLQQGKTIHVGAGQGVTVDTMTSRVTVFGEERHGVTAPVSGPGSGARREIQDMSPADARRPVKRHADIDVSRLEDLFPYHSLRDALRRCSRCVLPETMPFIEFDAAGVCNYCHSFRAPLWQGRDALEELVGPCRRDDGGPECLVAVSGGRDSTYGLHYVKNELGMNPVAYTYDWGMVTDLARRNVSRICGKLGIEHILVSADIAAKRDNIRKNVEAWLARPTLGTIPLFMAGDKAYFHYMSVVRKQMGVDLTFMCENPFEKTFFKAGYAGVPPDALSSSGRTLGLGSQLAFAAYYAKEFARNPRYLNSSILDTVKAFGIYYATSHDFYRNLYSYVPWDEATVDRVLLGQYDFEMAEDTQTTWRIGDGTASFYNYIYYTLAGLTENDTFRSNQVRMGAITREEALDLIDRDNKPRFPSIHWYLRTINVRQSTEEVLRLINEAPRLYAHPQSNVWKRSA